MEQSKNIDTLETYHIAPTEIEDIDVTIKLANRDITTPLGIVRDVEVLCGKIK